VNGLEPARPRWPVKGAIAVFVVGTAAGLLAASRPTDQPFPFNHAAHSGKSDCILCHRGARSEARAGLPSFDRCTGCHATAPGRTPGEDAEEKWRSLQQAEQAPRWNRLYEVPSHVYFSHRRHVTLGGISCTQCHGDIGASDRPPRFAAPASMRSCLTCHEREQVTVDCTACHR